VELPITNLRGVHAGYDLHVIATGPSAGFVDESFFDNKIAIGVNEAWMRFLNVDYLVRKETARSNAAYQTGIPLIVSKYNCGSRSATLNSFPGPHPYYVFDHEHNGLDEMDLSVVGTDRIVVSWSTITSAIHIAAYMGAANIVIVGHDCGVVDGKQRMPGLPQALGGETFHRDWLTKIEPQTIALRERLREVYGCNVYSINPFLNFGLEGHVYER
jgi:hypothetical protein